MTSEPCIPVYILIPVVFELALAQAKTFGEVSPATQELMDLMEEYSKNDK